MMRANRLAVLDPAIGHWPVLMRASAEQRVERVAISKDRDPEPVNLDSKSPPLGDLIHATDCSIFGHKATSQIL